MFVMTAKLSKPKLIAAGVLLVALILFIILLALPNSGKEAEAPAGASNDDRVAYLASFGWSVTAKPTEAQKVRIPDSADNQIFARYNELQKSQGFDLSDYAGQEVVRYVYEILNYPDAKAPVYATVLVADGSIIGGDVTDSSPDGVIRGFGKPGIFGENVSEEPSSEEDPASSAETEAPVETTLP